MADIAAINENHGPDGRFAESEGDGGLDAGHRAFDGFRLPDGLLRALDIAEAQAKAEN